MLAIAHGRPSTTDKLIDLLFEEAAHPLLSPIS
jgi:hypothetical protein